MSYPSLLNLKTKDEYREYWKLNYCQNYLITFDGIQVRFRKEDFDHAFFESVHSKDDVFSTKRAERMLWIKSALQDSFSERFIGWDNVKKRYDKSKGLQL